MPEELEILRINIILPEDSDDILALAPKDFDTNKKDKVKKWIEKSFKNLDRLKLNLGGELDAEGFFGMEQQGDSHPEKVLLCIYSKDKVKLSSFVAVLGNICFRPSTSKKGHIPFFGEWVSKKNWKSKVTLHGGYVKHTEMVRLRKILKKRRTLTQCVQPCNESKTNINYDLLQYYKPYIVDRHGKSKPVLNGYCDPNSQNNAVETINSKRKLKRTTNFSKDLNNPALMNSILKLNPHVFEQTMNKIKLTNLKQDSFENVSYRILCVYDKTKKRKSNENQYEIKNVDECNKLSDENDNSMKNYNELNIERYKKCRSGKPCKENIKDLCTLKAGKNVSKDDNCHANEDTNEGKYKIYLLKSPSTKSTHEEITNTEGRTKILSGSFKNLHTLSNIKPIKSIGVQVPSQFLSNRVKNKEFDEIIKPTNTLECQTCKIDEECSVKSTNLTSGHTRKERKPKNRTIKRDQIMTDLVRYQKIKNCEESLFVDKVSRCRKQRRTQGNCKTFYQCFECLGMRQNRRRPSSSFTGTYENKYSVKSYSDGENCPKHNNKVPKDERDCLKQSMSEEDLKRHGIFRKIFARKTKLKKDKSLRYYGKIYMDDETEREVTEPEIIIDGDRTGRTKVVKQQSLDRNSHLSFDEVSQILKMKNDGFCHYCGHSNRVRPIRCTHVIDSLEYMKKVKESKHHISKDLVSCVNKAKKKTSTEVQIPVVTGNYHENLELSDEESDTIQRKNTISNKRIDNLNSSKEFSRLANESQLATEQEAYTKINVKERNNKTLTEHRTETDFDANARIYSKHVSNTIEQSTMNDDWSKSKGALIKNKRSKCKRDSDKLKSECKKKSEIIDNWKNLTRKVKDNSTSNDRENDDEEHNLGREHLSSVLDIVKIKAEALHLKHVSSGRRKDYYNYRTTDSEFQPDDSELVPDNRFNTSNNKSDKIIRVTKDVDKSHSVEKNTKEENLSPAMALEDRLQDNKSNQINEKTNNKDIMFKTLNEALKALTSDEGIIETQMPLNIKNCKISNKVESTKSSNSDRKFFKKCLSQEKAALSLVEKRTKRKKARIASQLRRRTKESILKQKPIWSSDETLTVKLKDKRLFSSYS